MKITLTIDDNFFRIISHHASERIFTYMCHENISSQFTTIHVMQSVALMLMNDNYLDAEKT